MRPKNAQYAQLRITGRVAAASVCYWISYDQRQENQKLHQMLIVQAALPEMMRGRNMAKVRQFSRSTCSSQGVVHDAMRYVIGADNTMAVSLETDADNRNCKDRNRLAATTTTCAVHIFWAEEIYYCAYARRVPGARTRRTLKMRRQPRPAGLACNTVLC